MGQLTEIIKQNRKKNYASAGKFVEETGIDLPVPTYYAIEQGKLLPTAKDLYKIIKALDLNIKNTFLLWLHEHLPEDSLKNHFPLPLITKENYEDVTTFKHDEMQIISKSHIKFFTETRLARLLLIYTFTNSKNPIILDEYEQEFGAHPKKEIKKILEQLVDKGYIYIANEDKKSEREKYKANQRFLYIPKTPEFRPLNDAMATDAINRSNYETGFDSRYGVYGKGFCNVHVRTLSPEQVEFARELMTNNYNETVKLDPKAGQEYYLLFCLGAMNEK